ncbi:MAG TPA: hypothetical protein VLA97_10520 [Nocardioidaceae bacterium]|nr:hypothetical protein [Nocardioidaceae bacterium]
MTSELTRPEDLRAHRHLVVAERLRLRRRDLGLTQKEVVARLRRMGVVTTNKALSSLEHGAGLDVCKLPEVAAALECTLTYLVGLTDDPHRWVPDAGLRAGPAPADGHPEARADGHPEARADARADARPHGQGPRSGAGHHDRADDPAPRRHPPILGPLDVTGPVRRSR